MEMKAREPPAGSVIFCLSKAGSEAEELQRNKETGLQP